MCGLSAVGRPDFYIMGDFKYRGCRDFLRLRLRTVTVSVLLHFLMSHGIGAEAEREMTMQGCDSRREESLGALFGE